MTWRIIYSPAAVVILVCRPAVHNLKCTRHFHSYILLDWRRYGDVELTLTNSQSVPTRVRSIWKGRYQICACVCSQYLMFWFGLYLQTVEAQMHSCVSTLKSRKCLGVEAPVLSLCMLPVMCQLTLMNLPLLSCIRRISGILPSFVLILEIKTSMWVEPVQ